MTSNFTYLPSFPEIFTLIWMSLRVLFCIKLSTFSPIPISLLQNLCWVAHGCDGAKSVLIVSLLNFMYIHIPVHIKDKLEKWSFFVCSSFSLIFHLANDAVVAGFSFSLFAVPFTHLNRYPGLLIAYFSRYHNHIVIVGFFSFSLSLLGSPQWQIAYAHKVLV